VAVFFDKVIKYARGPLEASITRAFEELRVDLRGKASAFIKVNVVRPAKPSSAVVTHPAVVEALIGVLRAGGIREITIGEGPAVGVDVARAFARSGYSALARKMNVRLLDLHKSERVKKDWAYGVLELPSDVLSSDLYVNAAKMKTHYHTGVTLSIKSQQGLLTPQAKKANHRDRDLHRSLMEIARVIKPHLVIIDGVESMEGEGPTEGRKKKTGVMVYGDDPFETDIACCRFMGIDPMGIPHLKCAIEKGLAGNEPEIRGSAYRSGTPFTMPSPKPKRILNFYSWKNYRACAEDDHCFEEAIHYALVRPRYWLTFFPKFLSFVLLGKFHLLRGKEAPVPEMTGRLLCIGDCCRDVADKAGASFVPGCPPRPEDILKTVSRMK